MLVISPRHTVYDLKQWMSCERHDLIYYRSDVMQQKIDQSMRAIDTFVEKGNDWYAGVSAGKDSIVIMDLVLRIVSNAPIVHIRVWPILNPDNEIVLQKMMNIWNVEIDIIETRCRIDESGCHATGTLEAGFDIAIERYGQRHISGIRADESRDRKLRVMRWGLETKNTLAPIGKWTGEDVYAYLAGRNLPVHPAYACSRDGQWPRNRIRVASLGGKRGGDPRKEWERQYYGREVRNIEQMIREKQNDSSALSE